MQLLSPALRRPTRAGLLAVLVATGCASYDGALLAAPSSNASTRAPSVTDAGEHDGASATRGSTGAASGGAGAAGGEPDGGATNLPADAGDPDAQSHADAGDAEVADASAPVDAAAGADAGECSAGGGDCCPDDPDKTAPGSCGCGTADTDADNDGTPDCHDACPGDSGKTEPGVCGCGFADADDGCLGLRAALLHRYGFDGTGTTVTDAKGGANGTVVHTMLDGSGSLALAGGTSDQYVDLPNNLLSKLTDATLETWLSWTGGNTWQRIFDFGSSNRSEGMQGTGVTYLFLTPKGGGSTTSLHATFSTNGNGAEQTAASNMDLASSGTHHVVVVVDDTGDALVVYVDGAQVAKSSFTGHLSQLNDVNCWLGRSLFSNDPELSGTLHEFRIYGKALDAAQVKTSFDAGPDATFF